MNSIFRNLFTFLAMAMVSVIAACITACIIIAIIHNLEAFCLVCFGIWVLWFGLGAGNDADLLTLHDSVL